MRPLWIIDLGVVDYEKCVDLQVELHARRLAGDIEDTLLLLEHSPVITIGTSGGEQNLLVPESMLTKAGVKLCRTDRGGNITYHGPGQLVGYPIFDLRNYDKDAHLLLRNLEEVVIQSLGDFGIIGSRSEGLTGVWVGQEKICSIGVAVRKWVSYHGFAVNVNPDFSHWSLIHPCGLVGRQVTSISRCAGYDPLMGLVKDSVVDKCANVFAVKPIHKSLVDLGIEAAL